MVSDIYTQLNSYSFSLIPMFVIMGYFAEMSGMTKRLFDAFMSGWVDPRRPVCGHGLGVRSVRCRLRVRCCHRRHDRESGLSQMKRYNYDDSLSTGCIAAAGTLGPMIPPAGPWSSMRS